MEDRCGGRFLFGHYRNVGEEGYRVDLGYSVGKRRSSHDRYKSCCLAGKGPFDRVGGLSRQVDHFKDTKQERKTVNLCTRSIARRCKGECCVEDH